jgi:hypothetical protein
MNPHARRRSATLVWLGLILSSSCSSSASSKAREPQGSGRVVEVGQLPADHRELLKAYGAGGATWEAARERALADPALGQFLVENLFLEMMRAYRALDVSNDGRARRALERSREELTRFGGVAAPTLVAAIEVGDELSAELAADVLAQIGRPGLGAVTELLKNPAARARQRAAMALARMPHGAREEPQLREALVLASRDPDWTVRTQVARTLGARGARDLESAPWRLALEASLADADPLVAQAAAESLVQLDDPAAIPALIDALERASRSGETAVFGAAQAALVRLSGSPEQPSVEAWRAVWRAYLTRQKNR